MNELRLLPKEGDYTHVALKSGHACRVHAISPKDGKPGTVIPQRFHEAAFAAGCRAVGIGGFVDQEAQDSGKHALIMAAIESIIDTGDQEDLDGTGRPTLKAVKAQAGVGVTRVELDAAWAEFTNSLAD